VVRVSGAARAASVGVAGDPGYRVQTTNQQRSLPVPPSASRPTATVGPVAAAPPRTLLRNDSAPQDQAIDAPSIENELPQSGDSRPTTVLHLHGHRVVDVGVPLNRRELAPSSSPHDRG